MGGRGVHKLNKLTKTQNHLSLFHLSIYIYRDRERLFEKIRRADLNYPRYLSACSQHLLKGLLTRDPTLRLGSGEKDAEDIKGHIFFKNIDWVKLKSGSMEPPWNPQISGSLDTSQFDREFTSMPIFSPQSLQQVRAKVFIL